MLKCPFHQDQTASLQVHLEKNFYKCHACGKTGDVIQFVQDFEKLSKHEAILTCKALLGNMPNAVGTKQNTSENKFTAYSIEHVAFLSKMFSSFKNGLLSSKPAQGYCENRVLHYERLEIGFNSGQFHHGSRKDEQLIKNCLEYGLLLDKGLKSRTGETAYTIFGNKSLVFPLKNKENEIVSLYFRSILDTKNSKHYYLKDRQGLYPNYPKSDTIQLILTESIIDAASLLQIKEIAKNYCVLACYGTNGLNQEVQKAIKESTHLEEIIFFFDNDTAGQSATANYEAMLKEAFPNLIITQATPINKDINETLQLHDENIFVSLLNERLVLSNVEVKDIFICSASSDKVLGSTEIEAKEPDFSTEEKSETSATAFLKQPQLLKELNQLIGKAGIVSEENSRMLLFLIIISYLNKHPLHALVQGSSGSGKTHIISRIADLMPQEDVLRFTRITESSLYNWSEFDLFEKVVIIEDLDGLKEDALYALREFISNQVLRSSVTIKDKKRKQ